MKKYIYIAIMALAIACQPYNKPTQSTGIQVDSTYITADFRKYGDYYNSGHQVYAVDLLSEGLVYDSLWQISGTGCNLYLSDIFTYKNDTSRLPTGTYEMDSVAKDMSFLRGMSFDGSITGSYLLVIEKDQIQRILLFTSGNMTVHYVEEDIVLDFNLYTEDSTYYHATYTGPATYR